MSRGELEETLPISVEEQLPVYERLGAVRDTLARRARIALTLFARAPGPEDLTRANALICQALADVRRLRISEAEQIESILRAVGTHCEASPDE